MTEQEELIQGLLNGDADDYQAWKQGISIPSTKIGIFRVVEKVSFPLIQQIEKIDKDRKAAVKDLNEKDTALKTFEKQLSEKDTALKTIEKQLSEKDTALKTDEKQLSEKDTALKTVEKQLSEKDTALKTVENQLSEKDTALKTVEKQLAEYTGKSRFQRINWIAIISFAALIANLKHLISGYMYFLPAQFKTGYPLADIVLGLFMLLCLDSAIVIFMEKGKTVLAGFYAVGTVILTVVSLLFYEEKAAHYIYFIVSSIMFSGIIYGFALLRKEVSNES